MQWHTMLCWLVGMALKGSFESTVDQCQGRATRLHSHLDGRLISARVTARAEKPGIQQSVDAELVELIE